MRNLTLVSIIEHLNMGGEEKLVLEMMPALRNHGIVGHVISFLPGALDEELRARGIHLITLDVKPNILRIPALMACLRRLRPDVVHTRLFSAGLWGRVAARLSGVPAIVHTHGGFTFREKKCKRLPIEQLLVRATDRSICVSQAVKDHLIAEGHLPEDRLTVVSNGIAVNRFLHLPTGTPATPVRLVTVGRLAPVKGYDILIRALGLLKNVDFTLRMAGDGPDAAGLAGLARKLGIEGRITFLGTRADIPDLLAGSDIFIAPSRSEGLPVAVLEAMAAGRPVVASDVGGNREVLKGVGWLAPPDDPVALARVLIQVLKRPDEAAQRKRAARDRVVRQFTFEKMVAAHESLYRSCLTRKG